MKYQMTEPIARRDESGVKSSAEPGKLVKLQEDPLAEKRDMTSEQNAGLNPPGCTDTRVVSSERDQSRTK